MVATIMMFIIFMTEQNRHKTKISRWQAPGAGKTSLPIAVMLYPGERDAGSRTRNFNRVCGEYRYGLYLPME